MADVTIDRNLYLADDGETLVEEGDPRAAHHWALAGSTRSEAEAERVGYKPAKKSKQPSEDKAQDGPSEDKGSTRGRKR